VVPRRWASRTQLENVIVSFGPTDRSLSALVDSWTVEVLKFESELDGHWGDDDALIWGADDLLGTYSLRDAIESGLNELEVEAGTREVAGLAAVDKLLLSFTVEDHSTPIFRQGGEHAAWWWSRIPVRGPVPEQLEERARKRAAQHRLRDLLYCDTKKSTSVPCATRSHRGVEAAPPFGSATLIATLMDGPPRFQEPSTEAKKFPVAPQ
jgi:hypothetical protein